MSTSTEAWLVLSLVGLVFCASEPAVGDQAQPLPAASPQDTTQQESSASDSAERVQRLITSIVLENIPHEFEERDNWGNTTEVWDGLKVEVDGLRIKTKRRKKEVNHGTWKLYRIRLIDPERSFQVRVENLRAIPNGPVEFDTCVDARLDAFGRVSQWERGVQLISLSANAEAQVRVRVRCNLTAKLDTSQLLPAVVLNPVVTEADLQLVDFRLRRISQLSGPLVHELGKTLRELLENELARRRHKLPDKINRQIAKNRDDLRLSLQDVLGSQWGSFARDHLGIGAARQ
jgi:hypothetical protein